MTKLLIIDDEEDICDLIAEIAERYSFETRTVNSAEAASAAIADYVPDVILLDLMMPGTDGVELLRFLADKARQAKICLMSGSDTRVLNSARRLGSAHGLDVVETMEKPISIPVLNTFFETISQTGVEKIKVNHSQALAEGQFTLHYQPIIDMRTHEVKGVEALIRWQHPERGLLPPDEFMDQIVNDGLIRTLTDFVIKTSIRQAASWFNTGENFTLAMNITASTLLDLSLPDRIAELCAQHGVPAERLLLEVSETEAMRDVTRTMDVLLRMRLRNIGVAIDDFGIGHSSLRELQRMPFSELKIDKSFVMDMVTNRDSAVIVNSIIDLARNLGLKVIAEGVETSRVWQLLNEKGCDFAQGYYVARPMGADDFNEWLARWHQGHRPEHL